MRNILAVIIAVLFIGVPHGTHAAQTDWANGDSGTVVRTAIQANDTEIYSILSGTTPTLGPLNIGGTGDSWLELSNNTSLVDDITGKYGIRFSNGVLQQIINGTPSSIESGGSGYTTYPTYSDDTCTQGQYSFGTTPAPEMKCRATDTWDYLVVSGAALVWADWSNPTPTCTGTGTMGYNTVAASQSPIPTLYQDNIAPANICVTTGYIRVTTDFSAGKHLRIVVWDSSGVELALSNELTGDGTGGLKSIAFPTSLQITSGTTYRVGWVADHSLVALYNTDNAYDPLRDATYTSYPATTGMTWLVLDNRAFECYVTGD